MKTIISEERFQEAQQYESAYWISRQKDAVGILQDLESVFAIAQHLQREGYLKNRFHRFLDVGCGGLGIGILWLIQSEEAYGLDPLKVLPPQTGCSLLDKFVRGVQTRTKYLTAKAECLPFEDNVFDCLVCNNVLDHVHNPYTILSEIKRVLSPNGIFAFAVDTQSIRTIIHKKILKQICPKYGSIQGHPYEWTEGQMTEVLKMHGFAVESHVRRSIKGRMLGSARRTTWLLRHL